jgi:hypothetical protein
MKLATATTLALLTSACVSDVGVPPPTDAGVNDSNNTADVVGDAITTTDASPGDAPASDAPMCTMQLGSTGCDAIITAWCQAAYNCFNILTVPQCRMSLAANYPSDYDCNAQKFKKSVCANDAAKCAGDIPTFSCAKLMSYPAQLGGSCTTFFGEFP